MIRKQYTIQGPCSEETVTYYPDTGVVRLVDRADKDCYIELHDLSVRDSGYKIAWQGAAGVGVHYIPEAVFYNLPALLAIFSHAKGHTIFEPMEVYTQQRVAILFKESNNG